MHGPKKRAGGVGALEGVRTPSLVARAVMEQTDHHLIVGKGAQKFARSMGFKIEDDLNTERSRAAWLEWKRETDPLHYLDPDQARRKRCAASSLQMIAEGIIDRDHFYGTINCDGVNATGRRLRRDDDQRAGVEDSGPRRRLADSRRRPLRRRRGRRRGLDRARRGQPLQPLLVPHRRGDAPRRAPEGRRAWTALKRIKANTIEKRLLNARGEPNFNINFYMLNKKGEHAGVSMYGGPKRHVFGTATKTGRRPSRSSRCCQGRH